MQDPLRYQGPRRLHGCTGAVGTAQIYLAEEYFQAVGQKSEVASSLCVAITGTHATCDLESLPSMAQEPGMAPGTVGMERARRLRGRLRPCPSAIV